MNQYIVLLRGINVGGKNLLPMKDLKEILEGLGFLEVQTYIQSGNVVLKCSDELSQSDTQKICRAILNAKGFEPKIILISKDKLESIIQKNPYPINEGKALHFYFLATSCEKPDFEKLNSLKSETEMFELTSEAFYLYAPDGIGRSKLAMKIEKVLGVEMTARNWNTVSKISTML